MIDSTTVHTFVALLHEQAARVTAGMSEPGLMTLGRVHPNKDKDMVPQRFRIGDVEAMTKAAVNHAGRGYNCYAEMRTVRPGLKGKKRGSKDDTIAVFALVQDSDADKGAAGVSFDASLIVESSPGNAHRYVFLPVVTSDEAERLGQNLKAATGGDADTGVITQPYRVAGTPNYPNAAKRERGRTATPTRIIKVDGRVWTKEELDAAFPPPATPQERNNHIATGLTGIIDAGVEQLVAECSDDRSLQFFNACVAAREAGMTPDDLEELMRQYPDGCASKFLEPDRLRKEINRAWNKPRRRRRAAVAPTHPDNARTSKEQARAELEQLIGNFLDAPPPNYFEIYGGVTQRVHAVQATTGIGKTRIAAAVVARRIKNGRLAAPVGYAVPTHRLGEDIAQQFRDHGITAEVWRGRKAFVSGKSGPTMCADLGAIRIAEDMGAAIETSCCKGKDPDGKTATCPHYGDCAYQQQKNKRPDVWIFAHQMLFQQNKTLKGMSAIFIDESFRDAGTTKPVKGLTLDEIEAAPDDSNQLFVYRRMLLDALRAQPENGGAPRKNLEAVGLGTAECTHAITLEWARKDKRPTLWPGMPTRLRTAAANAGSGTKLIRTFHRVWAPRASYSSRTRMPSQAGSSWRIIKPRTAWCEL
jgi:RepB DNA-primase from phage plasmid